MLAGAYRLRCGGRCRHDPGSSEIALTGTQHRGQKVPDRLSFPETWHGVPGMLLSLPEIRCHLSGTEGSGSCGGIMIPPHPFISSGNYFPELQRKFSYEKQNFKILLLSHLVCNRINTFLREIRKNLNPPTSKTKFQWKQRGGGPLQWKRHNFVYSLFIILNSIQKSMQKKKRQAVLIENPCDWCGESGAIHQGGITDPDGASHSGYFCSRQHFELWKNALILKSDLKTRGIN